MRTVRKSYGQNIIGSFIGAILGIVLFLGSFVVLYINEGRENLGRISSDAVEITQEAHNLDDGTLICIKGSLTADNYAEDDYLALGDYIFIQRSVEMYAYVEREHSSSQDNFGGSTTTTYTYSYEKSWTPYPSKTTTYKGDSSEKPNDIPVGYDNWIDAILVSLSTSADGLQMGNYEVSGEPDFSGRKSLALTAEVGDFSGLGNVTYTSSYIFVGNQAGISANTPKLGDMRISYQVITAEDTGMLLGAIHGDTISSFTTPKNKSLFRYFNEASSREQMISILETEHKTMTWILRLVGWLMMFFGLVAMTGPITTFLKVIPIFSRISGFIFGVAAFFISLVLTTLTVLLSIILHNFWLAMALVIVIVVIVVIVIMQKRKNALKTGKKTTKRRRA